MVVIDQIGHEITLNKSPERIISLVPSQTELLIDMGLKSRIVGRTKFCIHPAEEVKNIPIVGGTKKFRWDTIKQLMPDLIIGNKEENHREDIETLRKDFPVWISDITTLEENFQMIRSLGGIVDKNKKALWIIKETEEAWGLLKGKFEGTVVYFIWDSPYMVAGKETFIDHLLQYLGFANIIRQKRYPEMDDYILAAMSPQYVFLSSEPFPFVEKHVARYKNIFPNASIKLVDGEMFSWYGSRLIKAADYFARFLKTK